jgi:glycosyltransferase involved in cell wall biosynthesis
MKIDLHVHSRYSTRPAAWVLKKIGTPESFTQPLQIYRIARRRGMSWVTISDHNRIEGALEIAHLPQTFISEEITTYFPEDGCKVHVLALNIDEDQHRDIQKARPDIFDLTALLAEQKIHHLLAHPLYAVNDRLTLDHFEKLLLLFEAFELNGARNDEANTCLLEILASLTREKIARMADRQGLTPRGVEPWRKVVAGGSDDHSGLNIARTHTVVPGAAAVDELLAGIAAGRAQVVRQPSTPLTLAHNIYGIAYQFYRSKLRLGRHIDRDRLMGFVDRCLSPEPEPQGHGLMARLYHFIPRRRGHASGVDVSDTLMGLLRQETQRLLQDAPELTRMADQGAMDGQPAEQVWFDFSCQAANRMLHGFADHVIGQVNGAKVFNIFQTIGSAGGLYTLLAPYFIAYSLFMRDRHFIRRVRQHFGARETTPEPSSLHVAHFTDTFYQVNGVALTLQQQVKAALAAGRRYTLVTCDDQQRSAEAGVANFDPVAVYALPEYPEQKIFIPPLLEMLDYCYRHKVTQIHAATPGPVGLAAMAIAHMLKLPISGTYHTQLPQYARQLTGDDLILELTWKYTLWFYDRMDIVYAPSESTRRELIDRGIRAEKIRCYPRGIDAQRFHPAKRNGFWKDRYGIDAVVKLLYVGRVSKEKNLPLLAEAYAALASQHPDIHLMVVGDGPYLPALRQLLEGLPCTFTGYLSGEDLAMAYASSDIFVFPSATDTFGNVVLEAQASGLPVIVTDRGGPAENVRAGRTGLVVAADDAAALKSAMRRLIEDATLCRQMGHRARAEMESRSFTGAFDQTWRMFQVLENPPLDIAAHAGNN